ncbi:aspartate aminotransferase family protein [Chitinimonas lacunae]|uniref:Aspartate aminotransferase family protein n=1 Tax=Chitinimonas lacunae TaxID=1963018 RepID=A0ABV8MV33_9NEIS
MSASTERAVLLDRCERHWSAAAAKLYRIAHSDVETAAEGGVVHGRDGRRYIDFACSYGVFIVGHRHPLVAERIQQALEQLAWLPPGTSHPSRAALSARLAALAPGDWGEVHYMNSGAEAIEQTLRYVLAVQAPRRRILAMADSYHGKTLAAMSVLGQNRTDTSFGPVTNAVEFLPYGDIAALRAAIDDTVAAVYIEPILGGMHLTVPPPGYLAELRRLCDAAGVLLVADEIQTAFGRCGRMFACEYDAVVPDMLVLSKGLTGGYASIACVMYGAALSARCPVEQVDRWGSSQGGHPFACEAALAALDVIESEQLVERAARQGERLCTGLRELARCFPRTVIDAPGIGLMAGLRLRGAACESLLSMELTKRGVHVGHSMNERAKAPVLRFYPPLAVEPETIDQVLALTAESLALIERKPRLALALMERFVNRMYALPNRLLRRLG